MKIFQSLTFAENSKLVYVDFRIKSDYLDPEIISAELGVLPTSAFAKGEKYESRARDPATDTIIKRWLYHPWGVWHFETKSLGSNKKVQEHLTFLLTTLEPRRKSIEKYLADEKNYSISIYIWYEPHDGHGSYEIPRELICRAASLCHYMEFGFVS